eukprot:s1923_g5.t1
MFSAGLLKRAYGHDSLVHARDVAGRTRRTTGRQQTEPQVVSRQSKTENEIKQRVEVGYRVPANGKANRV